VSCWQFVTLGAVRADNRDQSLWQRDFLCMGVSTVDDLE